MAYIIIWQRKKQFTVAGNREYQETDSINSIQSSLKSHPLYPVYLDNLKFTDTVFF